MTDPSSSPPAHEVLARLIDLVAWAKTCMLITAATTPSSSQRASELEQLRKAVLEPRRIVNEILGGLQKLPETLLVDLRTCELAIPKLEAGAVLRSGAAERQERRP